MKKTSIFNLIFLSDDSNRKIIYMIRLTLMLALISWHNVLGFAQSCFTCKTAPATTVFCDDFENGESLADRYFGYDDDNGEFIRVDNIGRDGSAGMQIKWQKGEVEAGVLQKSIGRSPDPNMIKTDFRERDFNEIYWRIDIKLEKGWEGGGGDKLSRATTIATKNWQQGMIAHIWSGGKTPDDDYLIMDPASGISEEGKLVSTKYNDFEKLRWLGSKKGNYPLFNKKNIGKWNCIVAHVKLNTPGKSDGIFEFWINDILQASRYDLNWHADWNTSSESYMINAIFFENYWNKGAPKDQVRYFDNILITTTPIQCNCSVQDK